MAPAKVMVGATQLTVIFVGNVKEPEMLYVILNAAKQAIEMELKRIERETEKKGTIPYSEDYIRALEACKEAVTRLMVFH